MIQLFDLVPETAAVVLVDQQDMKAFKELVQRGANLWPDAPAVIKEFADVVTTGRVLQDYKSQELKPKKAENETHTN